VHLVYVHVEIQVRAFMFFLTDKSSFGTSIQSCRKLGYTVHTDLNDGICSYVVSRQK